MLIDADYYHQAKDSSDKKSRNEALSKLLIEFPGSDYVGYALELKMSDDLRDAFCRHILGRTQYNNEQVLFVMLHGDAKSKEITKQKHAEYWESRAHEPWMQPNWPQNSYV